MKILTCEQMGGPCSFEMEANTPEEMMKEGMNHAEEVHPELAFAMKNMSSEENDNWKHSFMKTWRMTPNAK